MHTFFRSLNYSKIDIPAWIIMNHFFFELSSKIIIILCFLLLLWINVSQLYFSRLFFSLWMCVSVAGCVKVICTLKDCEWGDQVLRGAQAHGESANSRTLCSFLAPSVFISHLLNSESPVAHPPPWEDINVHWQIRYHTGHPQTLSLPQCHTAERVQPLHYSPYVTGNHVSHVTYSIHPN